MSTGIHGPLPLDVGIERILSDEAPDTVRLPESSPVVPGEACYEERLVKVLFPPSLEEQLVQSLRPEINNAELLTPARYHAMPEQTESELLEAAEHLSPGDQQPLRSAARLMDKQKELRDLLNMYRHLLHLG